MKIRKLNKNNLRSSLSLVWNTFCEFEAVNYSDDGKKAFFNAIHSEEYLDTLTAFGAYENRNLVGIIATRNKGTHIALFFVDGKYHNKGIGRSLWNAVLAENISETITVHSSLYAVDVYKKLGFIEIADVQEDGGIQYVPMVYKNLIYRLQDKDDKKEYALSKEIVAKSAATDEYYSCFDDFVGMMSAKSSYVRTRGFALCCAQARWDTQGKLQSALPAMLILLHDDKPTVVRQCLAALHEVALYHSELCETIMKELQSIEVSKYKDSMVPLIQKDINELLKVME